MKMITRILCLGFFASLTACAVFTTRTTKIMKVANSGIIQNPVVVDLDVKETKVTGFAEGKAKLGMETIKQDALVNALEQNNADVLVEPVYKTQRKFRKITVNVSGYPANYKNFRPLKESDLTILENEKVKTAQVQEKTTETKSKKPILRYILYGFLGILFIDFVAVLVNLIKG